MDAAHYIDEAKRTLRITKDAHLATKLELPNGHLAEMRSGKRAVPRHIAYQIAGILGIDPATLIANVEYEREKDERKRAIYAPFVIGQRAASGAIAALIAITANIQDAYASDTNDLSSNTESLGALGSPGVKRTICQLSELASNILTRIADLARSSFAVSQWRFGFAGW